MFHYRNSIALLNNNYLFVELPKYLVKFTKKNIDSQNIGIFLSN